MWIAAAWLAMAMVSCGVEALSQGVVKAALTPAAALPAGSYYAPETNLEALDATALASARRTIDLAAFSLTDKALVAVLADRAAHGVAIRIYLDRGEIQAECRGDSFCQRSPIHELLNLPGVEIRVKFSKVLMHLKSYAVDNSLERDGSANFSEQGEARQDNSAVFSAGRGAVAAFEAKFAGMWGRPDNLTVAQAIAGP
jgi:phosphatidylserine/phosphatidylglycerophosphate/cardiolipin synthase-like enzyme